MENSYSTAGQSNAVPVSSLVSDSGRVIERLSEIHNRLVKIGNTLHGSSPRDAGATGKIEPEPTLRRNVD